MPPGPERLMLADAAVRTWARRCGYGLSAPIPADVPTFEPSRDADGSLDVLRVYADAGKYVREHALAVHFFTIAREWLAEHHEEVGLPPLDEDAPPVPVDERAVFGY